MTILALTARLDRFVRKAYYGGATDHYVLKSNEFEKVYWYDVNSLYPFAMCNLMPFKPLEFINDLSKINIKDFFGFAFVKVECPKSIKIPYHIKLRQVKWFFLQELDTELISAKN